MRIIIFSGQGGAGVSTLAAATAVASARSGKRTLAFGLGAGLGAALDVALTYDAAEVAANLHALEARSGPDAPDEARDWLADFLAWRDMEAGLAEDLSSLPGMNHVGRLLELENLVETGAYDVIVVDGASLEQFLELPPALDATGRWLERLFAPRQQNVLEPFVRIFAQEYASTGEDVFERGRELLGRLVGLRDLMKDADVCSTRIVLNPPNSAVTNAREALTALSLFAFPVDALILTRLLPDDVADPFFDGIRAEQREALSVLATTVKPMPVLTTHLAPASPRGLVSLAGLAAEAYGEGAVDAVLNRHDGHTFGREDGRYVLTIPLPFARREDVSLQQLDEYIEVWVDGRRSILSLPEELRSREAASWSYDAPLLKVTFR